MNGFDRQPDVDIDRRSGPDRRTQANRRDGLDRRSGMDRRKSIEFVDFARPRSKPLFLLRRAINSLRRRSPKPEKPAKIAGAPESVSPNRIPRAHPRSECRTIAVLESGDSRKRCPATIINYSSAGFYVETAAPPPETTGVILHIANYRSTAPRPENVPRYFCQVRWSRKLPEQAGKGRFALGLKICTNLNEFTRLFSF